MMKENSQTGPGELLREKLVAFQREIAELKRTCREQEENFLRREQALLAELFEVLDAFEAMERNMRQKPEPLDKTALGLMKNMQAVQRKLLRLLGARQIQQLTFADGRARIDQCRVVATRSVPDRENEEILSIEKNGYVDVGRNAVLRKAEVVTVSNKE